jgi:hypothetical protein
VYQGNAYDFAAIVPAVIAAGLVNSLVTFQAPTGVLTSSGAPAQTGGDSGDGWNNVAGYIAIPCMDAPLTVGRITADEKKSIEEIEASNEDHIWLAGFYPGIETDTNWRAQVTDPAGNVSYWDVLGSESDSQAQTTRVKVQQVSI